jgi:hypothetical protein
MATLAVQTPAAGGSALTLAAATAGAGGDEFLNTGKEMPVVDNASGGAITVTFVARTACDHGVLHDLTWSVADGAREFHPPLDARRFNDPDTGRVKMTYSSATSVTVGVVKAT